MASARPNEALATDAEAFYTVRDVVIDATAASSAEARTAALAEGQRWALRDMYQRLVVREDIEFLPNDDAAASELIAGFEIDDEKVSPTRYRAVLHVAFNPQAMRLHLRSHRARFAESVSDGITVLPVFIDAIGARLWAEPNPWRDTWAARETDTSLLPVVMPLGDIEDFTIVNDASILQAPVETLRAFAARYGVTSLVVAIAQAPDLATQGSGVPSPSDDASAIAAAIAATGDEAGIPVDEPLDAEDLVAAELPPQEDGQVEGPVVAGPMAVTLRHVGAGGEETGQIVVTPGEGEALPDFLARGREMVVSELRERWKTTNLLRFDQKNVLLATVPLDAGLASWLDTRGKLRGLPVLVGVELAELSRASAVVRLTHLGDLERLSFALDGESLELVIDERGWVVQPRIEGAAGNGPDEGQ